MPSPLTRRGAVLALAAIASPFVIRAGALAAPPQGWRLSSSAEWPDFAQRFDDIGAQGTIVLHDALRGGRLSVNPARAQTGFLPGSTFKIPNSLIALHTGAAKDVDEETFKWNGQRFLVEGKPFLPPACDADIPLRVAFKNSCIPIYQELARRIGAEGFKEWLTKFDYGNVEIGGADLDSFWLKGDLRITAEQQVKFLRKLVTKTLPVSPRAIALTEEIMFIERIGDSAIHGKTGYVFDVTPATGWWVGYVQRGEDVVLVALNLDMTKPEHAGARYDLVKAALQGVGMI